MWCLLLWHLSIFANTNEINGLNDLHLSGRISVILATNQKSEEIVGFQYSFQIEAWKLPRCYQQTWKTLTCYCCRRITPPRLMDWQDCHFLFTNEQGSSHWANIAHFRQFNSIMYSLTAYCQSLGDGSLGTHMRYSQKYACSFWKKITSPLIHVECIETSLPMSQVYQCWMALVFRGTPSQLYNAISMWSATHAETHDLMQHAWFLLEMFGIYAQIIKTAEVPMF